MKQALIVCLLVVLQFMFAPPTQGALRLFINEYPVVLEEELVIVDDTIYAPLRLLSDYFGAQVQWLEQTGELMLQFPTSAMNMTVGSTDAVINGRRTSVHASPILVHGYPYVPLRFIADQLGLRLRFQFEQGGVQIMLQIPEHSQDEGPRFAQETESQVPSGTSVEHSSRNGEKEPDVHVIYVGGATSTFFIESEYRIQYESFIHVQPHQLTVELHNVASVGLPDLKDMGPLVQGIRSVVADSGQIRLEFDLAIAADYTISRWPDGSLEVSFDGDAVAQSRVAVDTHALENTEYSSLAIEPDAQHIATTPLPEAKELPFPKKLYRGVEKPDKLLLKGPIIAEHPLQPEGPADDSLTDEVVSPDADVELETPLESEAAPAASEPEVEFVQDEDLPSIMEESSGTKDEQEEPTVDEQAEEVVAQWVDPALAAAPVWHGLLPSIVDRLTASPVTENNMVEVVPIGGPRSSFFLEMSSYESYHSYILADPPRLVVDVEGVDGVVLPVGFSGCALVQSVRGGQMPDRVSRVVFDLHSPVGYRLNQWPDGGFELEFNYLIREVQLEQDAADFLVKLIVDYEPEVKFSYLTVPRRAVIDVMDTTLAGGPMEEHVDDGTVEYLRASQFLPSVTRIVLGLKAPMAVVETDFADGSMEIRFRSLAETTTDTMPERVDPERSGDSPHRQRLAVAGRTVAIDPGHGGSDPGAIGPRGTFEKDVVLDISLKVGAMLEELGAHVIYTRTDDSYVSIFQRPVIAESYGADIFVSIHANAHLEGMARGTETLYHPNRLVNQRLAAALQQELVRELQLIDRGLKPRTDLAVLARAQMPAALVEVAFVSHPEEELLLRSEGFQEAAAAAISKGVVAYFEQAEEWERGETNDAEQE